jgi:hypothetical protein
MASKCPGGDHDVEDEYKKLRREYVAEMNAKSTVIQGEIGRYAGIEHRSPEEEIALKAAQKKMKEFLDKYAQEEVVYRDRRKARLAFKRQEKHEEQRDQYFDGLTSKAVALQAEIVRFAGIDNRSPEEEVQLEDAQKKMKEFIDGYDHQQEDLRHLSDIVERGNCGDPGLPARLYRYTLALAELNGITNRTDAQQVKLDETKTKYAEALAEQEEERRAYGIMQRVHAISAHQMDHRHRDKL